MYVDVGLTPHLRQVRILCSADGSTHTESNTLYRKVKHRARPNSHELPALTALAQHISHSHSGIDEKRPTERCVSVCMHLDLFIVEQVRGARRAVESTSCLYVLCVGPLCSPPLQWWVLCAPPPPVWVPCGWGPVASSFHVASSRVMSRARAPAPGYKLHTCARSKFSLYLCI